MPDRERPARPEAERRLGVLPDRGARRGVAAVGDREAARQARQAPLVEDLGDQPEVLVEHQLVAVRGRDPGRLLAPVLEGEQPERGEPGGVAARSHHPEHAAHRPSPPRRGRAGGRAPTRGAGPRGPRSTASATRAPRPSAAPVAPSPASSMTRPSPPLTPISASGTPCVGGERRERRDGRGRARRRGPATGPRRRARRPASPRPRPGSARRGRPRWPSRRAPRRARRGRRPGPRRRAGRRWPPAGTPGGRPRGPGRGSAGRRRRPRRGRRTRSRRGPGPSSPPASTTRSSAAERRPDQQVDVVGEPHDADLRRRGDRAPGRLVVQRDVAAGHRDPEGPAGVAEAAHGLLQLPERLRAGRVAEVEAVRHAQRARAGDAHVAGRLGDRHRGAEVRVERGDGLVAVGGGDEGAARPLHPEDGRAPAGPGHRVRLDVVVVLLVDPAARRQVRAAEEAQEHGPRVHPALGQQLGRGRREARGRGGAAAGRRRGEALEDDRLRGEGAGRDPGELARARARPPVRVEAALDDRDRAVVGHPADHRAGQAPAGADLGDLGVPLGADDRDHPLLRLADHHLEGGHPRLPARDRVEVDEDPRPGPVGGLADAAGDAGRPEVLDALGEAPVDDLEGRLDEQLLGERVADLDGRALGGVLVAERGAGEDRGAADPVAAGRAAVEDDEVAGPRRGGPHDPVLADDPDRHHVDQRVALVGRVEDELAADRRHADAVAVAADAADHAVHEVAGPRVAGIAEAEGVEDGDRPGAHREDVAQDAADAGRGALVRLDRAGVVVRLDLEGDREPVADPLHAGVLARPGHDVVAAGGERRQERPAALVRAVLAPHDAEHRELEVVGRAAQLRLDRDELLVGQAEGAVERHGRRAHRGPPRDGSIADDRFMAGTSSRRRPRARGRLHERAQDRQPVGRAQERLGGALRVGHQAGHVPGRVHHPGDRPQRAVRVRRVVRLAGRRPVGPDVAEQDLPVALERVERRRVGVVAALAVGDRHPQRPALSDEARERRVAGAPGRWRSPGTRSAGSGCAGARRGRGPPPPAPGSRCRCRGRGRRPRRRRPRRASPG